MSADVGQSVRYRIAATAEVTNVIGARVYADALDQGINPPSVIVEVPDATPYEDLNSSNRCFASTVVVTAFGRTRDEANSVAKLIRDYALPADLQGVVHGMDFRDVSLVSGPSEMALAPPDGSNTWTRMTRQTFSIWANPI